MSTTVDELIVKIRGDVSELERSLKTAEKKSKKSTTRLQRAFGGLKKGISNLSSRFLNLRSAIGAVAGAAGLGFLIKSSLSAADEIVNTSKQLGFQTDALQELSFAAQEAGIEQSTLESSLDSFTRRLGKAANGTGAAVKTYERLGIAVRDSNGNVRDSEEVFAELSDAMANMSSESERAATAQFTMSQAGAKMALLMSQGSEEVNKLRQSAHELGLVIDKDLLETASETNGELDTLGIVLRTHVTKAVAESAPEILALTKSITGLMSEMAEGISSVKKWGEALKQTLGFEAKDSQVQLDLLNNEIGNLMDRIEAAEKGSSLGALAERSKLDEMKSGLQELIEERKTLLSSMSEEKSSIEKTSKASKKAFNNESKQIEERMKLQKDAQKIVDNARGGDQERRIQEELDLLQKASDKELEIEGNLNQAIQEQKMMLKQAEQKRMEEDLNLLRNKNEAINEEHIAQAQRRVDADKGAIQEIKAQELSLLGNRIDSENKFVDLAIAAQSERVQQTQAVLGELSSLTSSTSKKMFEVGKAAAVAQSLINTYQASTKAMAQGGFFGFTMAAAVTAKGLAEVQNIRSQGFQMGTDSVPGIGRGDRVPAVLEPGERVVPRETNQDLTRFLKRMEQRQGAGGGTTINNTFQIGTVLDGQESSLRIVQMINDATRKQGAVLEV